MDVANKEMVVAAVLIPDTLTRPLVTIALFVLPQPLEIAICAMLVVGGVCLVAVRPVREPRRALVYRMATLHRVAGPGYVWLIPFLDRVEQEISVIEHEAIILPSGVRTSDDHMLKMRLEVAWRIAPTVHGCPSDAVRLTLLLPEDRRAKLVEEAITRAAIRAVGTYSLADLGAADVRDEVLATLAGEAGAGLASKGIEVMRVFWRL